MKIQNVLVLSFLTLNVCACAEAIPPPASASTAPSGDTVVAAKPERAALEKHFKDHVKYPAARAEILKACADTPEFTAGQKKWIEANLPEGTYQSADDVIAAVKL